MNFIRELLPCPVCSTPHFHSLESLRVALISAATAHLTCPICSASCLGLDKFTIHLFSHLPHCFGIDSGGTEVAVQTECDSAVTVVAPVVANEQSEKHRCDVCNKVFKKKGSLTIHVRLAHYQPPANVSAAPTLKKRWECATCNKFFTTKYFLKKHNRLHTGEMPYYCQQCNKAFTFQQSYHKHMLYHTTDKPHVCAVCERAFKELSTLQNHQRIHSGERPFACTHCAKRFRQRVSYLVHQRIHTGVMPYECNACGKTFRYKVSLRSHRCATLDTNQNYEGQGTLAGASSKDNTTIVANFIDLEPFLDFEPLMESLSLTPTPLTTTSMVQPIASIHSNTSQQFPSLDVHNSQLQIPQNL